MTGACLPAEIHVFDVLLLLQRLCSLAFLDCVSLRLKPRLGCSVVDGTPVKPTKRELPAADRFRLRTSEV